MNQRVAKTTEQTTEQTTSRRKSSTSSRLLETGTGIYFVRVRHTRFSSHQTQESTSSLVLPSSRAHCSPTSSSSQPERRTQSHPLLSLLPYSTVLCTGPAHCHPLSTVTSNSDTVTVSFQGPSTHPSRQQLSAAVPECWFFACVLCEALKSPWSPGRPGIRHRQAQASHRSARCSACSVLDIVSLGGQHIMDDTSLHIPDDTLSYIAPIGESCTRYLWSRCRISSPILPNHLYPVSDLCHAVGPFVMVLFLSSCIGQKFILFSSPSC